MSRDVDSCESKMTIDLDMMLVEMGTWYHFALACRKLVYLLDFVFKNKQF